MAIATRSSHRKATSAVACKLAAIMHAMWVDGAFAKSEIRSVSRNER
jgi:transposase